MESPTFELGKMLEENTNEASHILGSFFRCSLNTFKTSNMRSRCHIALTTASPYSAYENPTPIGWSTKKMFAFVFHDSGWTTVELSSLTLQGPSSMNKPIDDEQPGPVHYANQNASRCLKDSEKIHTSVSPENHIICIRIVATLEEIEEYMSSLNINVPSIRADNIKSAS